jgi:fumarate reductase subunit D
MTNSIPQETVNTVLIDMLKGAKDAGSEIYSAGKYSIIKAVDFAQEQAPMVVQEFVTWKFYEALTNFVLYMIPVVIMLSIIIYCIRYFRSDKYKSEEMCAALIISTILSIVLSAVIFIIHIIPAINTMVKAKIAPRVFVIEWVSSQIKR